MRNVYISDTLPSVVIQETVKIGCKINYIYEGVVYRKNFKIGLFKK